MTLIISGFPGVGKTTFKNNHPELVVLDSDSSQYSKDESFPQNYIEHVKENIGKADVILLSSHKVVRNALDKEGIKYTAVFPLRINEGQEYSRDYEYIAKSEYIQRYRDRGNTEDFIKLIGDNWEAWISDLILTSPKYYPLEEGEYLEDAWRVLSATR